VSSIDPAACAGIDTFHKGIEHPMFPLTDLDPGALFAEDAAPLPFVERPLIFPSPVLVGRQSSDGIRMIEVRNMSPWSSFPMSGRRSC
jgi:hypothetical protein